MKTCSKCGLSEFYRSSCKNCIKNYIKEYNSINKDKIAQYKKVYHQTNKEQLAIKRRLNRKLRRQTDINYKLKCNLRNRIYMAIKYNKPGSAVKDLGCSIEQLKVYLESKWVLGMTWANYGKEWHIDHIKPLSKFELTNRKELLKVVHYTNLQPLWASDNLNKSNKLI